MLGPEDTVARRLFRGAYLHFDIENDYQLVDIRPKTPKTRAREMVRLRHEDWLMCNGKLVPRLNNYSGADLQPRKYLLVCSYVGPMLGAFLRGSSGNNTFVLPPLVTSNLPPY